MLPKRKAAWILVLIIAGLCLSSCSPASPLPATDTANTEAPSQPVLKTSMGDFVIASSRLVDEVHGQQAQSGRKFLLLIFSEPDLTNLVPGEFSLEEFQKMMQDNSGQINVSGSDSSQNISTMAGWVDDEFAVGFIVPIAESYTLNWPGNSPIALSPTE